MNKNQMKSTLKSNDTEEWLDVVFTRRVGFLWAKFFEKLGVHPNTVTILSMIIGACSAFFFASGSYHYCGVHGLIMNIIAVLLLMWANFYDSADGQLARMTNQKTALGRILDGAASDVWFVPIYFALVLRFTWHHTDEFNWLGIADTQTNTTIAFFVLLIVALISGLWGHAGQCRMADYYRQIHLLFVNGKAGSELDNSEKQKEKYDAMPWEGHRLEKFFQKNYVSYTRAQEKATPEFQKLRKALTERYSDISNVPEDFRNEFRKQSLPLMKYTNILTFNTRAIVLYLCCLFDRPWLYFVFEIVIMSLLAYYMRYRHERMCRNFYNGLK